jgi:hypothetical protein
VIKVSGGDMKHGRYTAAFGKKLGQRLQKTDYTVWYDHGDPKTDPHVLKTSGYYGVELSNESKLAEIDIMITEGDRIRCLVEIEENPVSPKKILGDAFTICMCNGFAINKGGKRKQYLFDDETELLIACWFNPKGKGVSKLQLLEERFRGFKGLRDGLSVEKVHFIHAGDVEGLLNELEQKIDKLL